MILNFLSSAVPNSLIIPGKLSQNQRAMGMFSVQKTNDSRQAQSVMQQGGAVYQAPSGLFYFALPSNMISYSFIQRVNEVQEDISLQSVPVKTEEIQKVLGAVYGKFPEKDGGISLYEALDILTVARAIGQDEKVDMSARVVLNKSVVEPFNEFISQFLSQNEQLAKALNDMRSMQTMVVQGEQMKFPAGSEESQQLDQMKQNVEQMQAALKGVALKDILKQVGLPADRNEFTAAVNQQLVRMLMLAEVDSEELMAHQDVLNSAILSW